MPAYNAKVLTTFHWFHASKAFDNRRDHRTCAQVIKHKNFHNENKGLKPCNSTPHIVTVNNKNVKVKSTLVTPSKVSVNAQGCTSPKRPYLLGHGFKVIGAGQDNSSDIRYAEKGGSHGEVQPCKDYNVLSSKNDAHFLSIHGNSGSDSNQFHHVEKTKKNVTKTLSSYSSKQKETVINNVAPSDIQVENLSLCKEGNNHNVSHPFSVKTYKHVTKQDKYEDLVDQQKIPLYVWKNKHLSQDHVACLSQNGGDFGYIPLNDLLGKSTPHFRGSQNNM